MEISKASPEWQLLSHLHGERDNDLGVIIDTAGCVPPGQETQQFTSFDSPSYVS